MFLVSRDSYEIGSIQQTMGGDDMQSEVLFRDSFVPADNMIGESGKAFVYAVQFLGNERLSMASHAIGMSDLALREMKAWAKERKQFGKPIIDYQMVMQLLADMATGVQTCRLITYYAAWLKQTGRPCNVEASEAKVHVTETARKVCLDGMQVMGGYGYLREFNMQRFVRDSLLGPIGGGTNQIQRLIIGKNL